MSNYRLSEAARIDIIRIHQYGVVQFGLAQADRYFDLLFKYFDRISNDPYMFEAVDYLKQGYRRCNCGSDSIYYRITDEVVEIMAIIGKQDLNKLR